MDLDRFRKVCALMASDHVGERAAAALKATAILKAEGKTWETVSVNDAAGAFGVNHVNIDHAALEKYWESMYRGEREQSERRAKEIQKLKTEVTRLKSMWPNGEPPKRRPPKPKATQEAEAESLLDYDKMLREKVAAALELGANRELLLSTKTLAFFRSIMLQATWTDRQREAVEKTLRWIYAGRGG